MGQQLNERPDLQTLHAKLARLLNPHNERVGQALMPPAGALPPLP